MIHCKFFLCVISLANTIFYFFLQAIHSSPIDVLCCRYVKSATTWLRVVHQQNQSEKQFLSVLSNWQSTVLHSSSRPSNTCPCLHITYRLDFLYFDLDQSSCPCLFVQNAAVHLLTSTRKHSSLCRYSPAACSIVVLRCFYLLLKL